MKRSEIEKSEAREQLLKWIKPGDTVYTILRHVSRSGMQREIGVVLIGDRDERTGEPVTLHPNYSVAQLIGARQSKGSDSGVIVGGCGMDMGFHIVYNLGRALWPDGYGCIGEGCRSNDHTNGDRDYTPHGCIDARHCDTSRRNPACPEACGLSATARDHWHTDGGYALRHRWL